MEYLLGHYLIQKTPLGSGISHVSNVVNFGIHLSAASSLAHPRLRKMHYFARPYPSPFWRIRGVLHFGLNFYLADPIYVVDINMTERRDSTDRLPSLQIAHYQGMIANAIEKTARRYKCINYRHSL